jgi:hypothetical protein
MNLKILLQTAKAQRREGKAGGHGGPLACELMISLRLRAFAVNEFGLPR